jgi:N-acetylglucosamine malate deacetylase 1
MKDLHPFPNVERALILCAHTDDEFGCAGTLLRLQRSGVNVRYIALSRCEESVPSGLPKNVLETECRRCLSQLGVPDDQIEIGDFAVRRFPEHRQEILERLYRLNQEFRPDLVLMPTVYDRHQDHATVCAEGIRAFKNTTLIGYELPQNVLCFENEMFVTLSEEVVTNKVKALACYESQGFRPYSNPEYIRGLARVRGVQCGTPYAEAFEAIRIVLR